VKIANPPMPEPKPGQPSIDGRPHAPTTKTPVPAMDGRPHGPSANGPPAGDKSPAVGKPEAEGGVSM